MIDERGSAVNDDADGLLRLGEAAEALEGLREPAERAAQAIDDAFARAGSSLARSLARAAADGEISLAELARVMLTTLNGLFGGGRGLGLESLVGGLAAGLGGVLGRVFGAGSAAPAALSPLSSASPVAAEPTASMVPPGAPAPPAAPVVVNLSLNGPAEGLLRSEAQLAQTLARAVALGARRL